MSTILITSDWHLNDMQRDDYRHKFQAQLLELVRKHKVGCVLFLGDLTDEKDHHSAVLVNWVVSHLHKLSRLCSVIMLAGNHDRASAAEVAYFAFLGHLEHVSWVGAPATAASLKIEPLASLGPPESVLFLPHTPDYKRDWGGLALKGLNWVFAHATFAGASVGHRRLEGVPTDLFYKTRVISGDIHVPQTLGPVTYVGAPYLVDHGDDYEPRVLLIQNGKLASIPCTGPQKRLVDVTWPTLPNKSNRLAKGDIVKVRITITAADYPKWSEIKQKAEHWAQDRGLIVDKILPVVEQVSSRSMHKGKSRHAPKTDTEILTAYIKQRGIDKHVAEIGLKLLD